MSVRVLLATVLIGVSLAAPASAAVGGPHPALTSASHGFLFDGGVFTTIDFPGAARGTAARGINNAGQVVGFYEDARRTQHGFLMQADGFKPLDFPGARSTRAFRVSNGLQVVGDYSLTSATPDNGTGGYLLDGAYADVSVPGATETQLFGLNDNASKAGTKNRSSNGSTRSSASSDFGGGSGAFRSRRRFKQPALPPGGSRRGRAPRIAVVLQPDDRDARAECPARG